MDIMPSFEECQAGLAALPVEEREKWLEFQRRWFYDGLPNSFAVSLHAGIDGEVAFRHLKVQGSYAPKHKHKEAAVAYLASRWFQDLSWGDEWEDVDDNVSPVAR